MSLADQSLKGRLLDAVRTGDVVDLAGETLAAEVLRSVLLDPEVASSSMLSFLGATIDGPLDLSGAQIPGLVFTNCAFPAPIAFADCWGRMLTFADCKLSSVSCPALALDGSLQMTGCIVAGQVDLAGARVDGRLVLDRTDIDSRGAWPSFAGDDLLVAGTFDAFAVEVSNGISVSSAKVGGHVRLCGANLRGGGRAAFAAAGLRVGGSLDLSPHEGSRFSADGEVELDGARIDASLMLVGASLKAHEDDALSAAFLGVGEIINGQVRGSQRLEALGTVRLQNVKAGAVYLSGAQLDGDGEPALIASGIEVSGDLYCMATHDLRFVANGPVDLTDAQIGGQLGFSGALLRTRGDVALRGDGLRAQRGGFFSERYGSFFTVEGEMRITNAEFNNSLDFCGAQLSDPGGHALSGSGLTVHGDAFFQDVSGAPFVATGHVELPGCVVSGQLGFEHARLSDQLNLEEADIASLWIRFDHPPKRLVLFNAKVGRLYHHRDSENELASFPTVLWNCHYSALDSIPYLDVEEHLQWLARDPVGYLPQPYEELASAYARAGHEEEARAVLIAKQRRRRSVLSRRGKVGSYLLGATVAHGYRSSQAALWLGALLLVGACLFGFVFDAGAPDQHHDLTPARDVTQVPGFQPIFYALDVLLPVIDLGQGSAWNAHGTALWVSVGLACSGWLLTAALVAGIAAKRR